MFNKKQFVLSIIFLCTISIVNFLLMIKFVQLGIPDLITNVLFSELSFEEVTPILTGASTALALCGLFGCFFAGFILNKYPISFNKKQIINAVLMGIILFFIYISNFISPNLLYLWVILFATCFGAFTCIVYTFLFDILPKKNRGLVTGFSVAMIYFIGASSSDVWTFHQFRSDALILLSISFIIMVVFLMFRVFQESYIQQIHEEGKKYNIGLKTVLIMLSLVLFIDSFGFLRITSEGVLENATITILSVTWQNPSNIFRLYIGIAHVASAIVVSILYNKIKPFKVICISLILFVIADVLIGISTFERIGSISTTEGFMSIQYIFPPIYASAVSIYTLVFLTLLADISDEKTIYRNVSIGMGLIGWFSSFIATGLSLFLAATIPFYVHLLAASVIAIIALVIVLILKKKNSL